MSDRYPNLTAAFEAGRIDGSRLPDPAQRELRDLPIVEEMPTWYEFASKEFGYLGRMRIPGRLRRGYLTDLWDEMKDGRYVLPPDWNPARPYATEGQWLESITAEHTVVEVDKYKVPLFHAGWEPSHPYDRTVWGWPWNKAFKRKGSR